MDGYLKIKTKIDNKDVDKGIAELENKIKKAQQDNSNLSQEQSSLQKEIDDYKILQEKADEYKNKIQELNKEKQNMFSGNLSGKLSNEQLPQYQNIVSELDKVRMKYSQTTSEIDKQSPKIEKIYSKLDKIKSKQTENNAKMSEYKNKIEQINLNKVQNSLNSVGKNLQNQIGSLARISMSIVGIRTGINMTRSAISMVSQYNKQVSADMEYMRYCIANAIAPAIQGVIKLLYTVLSYVNAIANAWFGINLFGNSSVKNFQKMQKSASGTAKSAKEIQKSLQGFDEMNILQSNQNSDSGSSGGGIETPSSDLSNMDIKIPKWIKWIMDNKNLILGVLGTIAGIIAGIKIMNLIKGIKGLTSGTSELIKKLTMVEGKLKLIKAIGLALIITGVILLIKDIICLIKDPCWKNFGQILIDIGIILAGIALLLGNWVIGIVALIAIIGGLCIKLFNQEEAILSVENAQRKLEEATKNLEEANDSYIDSVDKAERTLQTLKEAQERTGMSGEELNKKVEQGILDYKDMTAQQKEVYKAYLDNEKAQKELEESTEKLTEAKKQEKVASWENKLAIMAEAGQYDEYKKAVVDAFEKGELSAEEARDLIGKSMSEMSRDSQQTFMKDLPEDIKNGLDPKKYETAGQKISKWFGELTKNISKSLKQIGQGLGNLFSGKSLVTNNVPIPSVPRLAVGGIVNNPGRGVPIGGAIAGEAGREGVIPLTDPSAMAQLGQEIGKWITVNNTLNNYMDGRLIQRQIAKRNDELAFATNR